MILQEFHCANIVQNCAYNQIIKSHLIKIKGKDIMYLFVAVRFVKSKGNSEYRVVYFSKHNKAEALVLLKYNKFQNKFEIIK